MGECVNIMVVSDDHGMLGFDLAYRMAVEKYGSVDYLIHAGDIENRNNEYYEKICGCPAYIVRGNNDYNDNPFEILTEIAGKKFFITHGHKYGVYMGLQNLAYAAEEKGADVAVFGHTHHSCHIDAKGMVFLNPGSLTLPRGNKTGSFAMIIVQNDIISVDFISTDW